MCMWAILFAAIYARTASIRKLYSTHFRYISATAKHRAYNAASRNMPSGARARCGCWCVCVCALTPRVVVCVGAIIMKFVWNSHIIMWANVCIKYTMLCATIKSQTLGPTKRHKYLSNFQSFNQQSIYKAIILLTPTNSFPHSLVFGKHNQDK